MKKAHEPLIVMFGSAGAAAALELSEIYRDDYTKYFPRHFQRKKERLQWEQEALINLFTGNQIQEWENRFPCICGEGVFSCLWKLAEESNAGMVIDLYSIPVHQFTIELCEKYGKNPYTEKIGAGGMVITDTPDDLLALGRNLQISAAVIGRLQEGKDRIIRNKEIIRFLTPEGI